MQIFPFFYVLRVYKERRKQNVELKDFFEKDAYFVDIFNAYFFNGEKLFKKNI